MDGIPRESINSIAYDNYTRRKDSRHQRPIPYLYQASSQLGRTVPTGRTVCLSVSFSPASPFQVHVPLGVA